MPSVSHTGGGLTHWRMSLRQWQLISSNATSTSRYRGPANRSWMSPCSNHRMERDAGRRHRHAKRHAQLGRPQHATRAGREREKHGVCGPVLEEGGQPSTSTLNPASTATMWSRASSYPLESSKLKQVDARSHQSRRHETKTLWVMPLGLQWSMRTTCSCLK
jgi:hypothetical protein